MAPPVSHLRNRAKARESCFLIVPICRPVVSANRLDGISVDIPQSTITFVRVPADAIIVDNFFVPHESSYLIAILPNPLFFDPSSSVRRPALHEEKRGDGRFQQHGPNAAALCS